MRNTSIILREVTRVVGAMAVAASMASPASGQAGRAPSTVDGEWRAYGRDALGSRWSPLAEITRENVSRLEPAWTYHTGETAPEFAGRRRQRSLEVTPLVADGRMFISTPLGRVMALDPETGRELWKFDPKVDRAVTFGDFTSRGVSYWVDSRRPTQSGGECVRRVIVATIDGRLIALDADRGTPCPSFGVRGTVDLRASLRNKPEESAEYEVTSPPAIINDIIVVGSAVADNSRTDAASGEVRAFDARTGALRWTWDPIPQDSADAAWRTWVGPRAHATGAANAWSVIAADPARDLVFVPTGSASPDYFGGERLGDNRYANSIVALRASTGRVVWHFQVVHHDLWDYDVASPPALVTLRKGGKNIPVVLQSTKTGQLFVLDRDTGVPVFPVEERSVPPSDVPGERASPTQPFNTILPPLSPQRLTPADAFGATEGDRAACRARIEGLRNEGPFTPPSERGSLVYPSSIGGAHWGGVTYDPVRQIVVVPVNRIPIEVKLIPARIVRPEHGHRRRGDARPRGAVHRHARHPVRHATPVHVRAGRRTVLTATVRVAGCDRPQHRHEEMGRTPRIVRPDAAAGRRFCTRCRARVGQPRWGNHDCGRDRVHRRGARSFAARVRHRNRPRALARIASGGSEGHADDVPRAARRAPICGGRRGRGWRALWMVRRDRGISAEAVSREG